MEFFEWMTQKYIEWRGSAIGHERTVTDYAAYIGVSQQVMSAWMKKDGNVPRGMKTISKLSAKYPEVYEILDIPRPELDEPWDQLPPELRGRLRTAVREINATYRAREVNPDDEEALSIAEEILGKYGFNVSETENVEDDE